MALVRVPLAVLLLHWVSGVAIAQELVVYRSVADDGVVSFSDKPEPRTTPQVVQTYDPNDNAVESAADQAATAAELADQLAAERYERAAMVAAARARSRPETSANDEDSVGQSSSEFRRYGGYPYPYRQHRPHRPQQRPRPPVETNVGTHFKAGWPGRLHPFGPAGSNQVETTE